MGGSMWNVVVLELRKHRGFAAGILLIVLSVLLAEAVIGAGSSESTGSSESSASLFFQTLRISALAASVLCGCFSGSSLRKQPAKPVEQLYPVHPAVRVLGTCLASLAIPAALLLASAGFAKDAAELMQVLLAGPFLLILHVLSFLISYGSKIPVVAAGAASTSTFFGYWLLSQSVWSIDPATCAVRIVLSLLIAWFLFLGCLTFLARRLEIDSPTSRANLACIVLLSILWPAFLLVHINSIASALDEELVREGADFALGSVPPRLNPLDGVLFSTRISRSPVLVTPDGNKRVLFRSPSPPFSALLGYRALLDRQHDFGLKDLLVGSEGTWWGLLRTSPYRFAILKGSPNGLFPYSQFDSGSYYPPSLYTQNNRPCVYSDNWYVYACFDSPSTTLNWMPARLLDGVRLQPNVFGSNYNLAEISPDGKRLEIEEKQGERKKWSLPAKAPFSGTSSPHVSKGPSIYSLPVLFAYNRATIAVCLPDGSVKMPWNYTWQITRRGSGDLYAKRNDIPEGGISWQVDRGNGALLVMGSDGTVFPPFSLAWLSRGSWRKNYAQANNLQALRLSGSKLWLRSGFSVLIEVDLVRGTKKVLTLPFKWEQRITSFENPSPAGLFFLVDDRIFFVDWEGKVRDLGHARL